MIAREVFFLGWGGGNIKTLIRWVLIFRSTEQPQKNLKTMSNEYTGPLKNHPLTVCKALSWLKMLYKCSVLLVLCVHYGASVDSDHV